MELKWPILLLPILIGVAVAVWAARRRSHHGWQGELPYLARSFRLTELPEYRRALRLHERLSVAALVFAIVLVATMTIATLRPTRTYENKPPGSDTPFVDIMLCFGPGTDFFGSAEVGLASVLTSLRDKVDSFGNQRIGMTHELYRVFPVTGDHQWVSDRMSEIIEIAEKLQKDGNSFAARLSMNTDVYERRWSSVSVVDTLAMCTIGLPAAGTDNGRARQIVFIGDTRLPDDPDWSNPSSEKRIYAKETLTEVVKAARVQVNAIVPRQVTGPMGFVENLINETGGQQIMYSKVGGFLGENASPEHLANQEEELSKAVTVILDKPPSSTLDEARQQTAAPFQWDVPGVFLTIALLAATGLAACRWGMRL
ncbi:Uncharacterised protein [Mycolicibacterium phlei]|jgi:Ca-activated chloride channel family protein|uniref:VWFA domain-containing protein n=1 Tax=Mycolicibacterium phlei DSM 43239 = CCUG 21000 TaxID=1226750 RepID=A0A5N5VGC5_MYCPH|nr:hypothetical protein [Mycolicibacterium phlei]VEG11721.1 Uncharacterised protein [Mycobacteroides chelonae]AMO63627.1 hypothetical protein MPHLCCUG_04842 [Mycolicibacterium phlei]EID12834.1 hypothetical protein MPHLEI_15976 [Mycolicibacterium phlei RIVM601174]KAB7759539.1 hypothetical protein MPHL21000_00460 [Mycolicibacterium phlei DSM 43239 = CCUG 21000]KXW60159.1 hypothetical protein MPHL43072_10750 [Mycolicibacterium phlei DSM 43072]